MFVALFYSFFYISYERHQNVRSDSLTFSGVRLVRSVRSQSDPDHTFSFPFNDETAASHVMLNACPTCLLAPPPCPELAPSMDPPLCRDVARRTPIPHHIKPLESRPFGRPRDVTIVACFIACSPPCNLLNLRGSSVAISSSSSSVFLITDSFPSPWVLPKLKIF